jgi:hypothetical protein
MKIKTYTTKDVDSLRKWMKNEFFDWHNHYELISMVKDQGVYEVFYSEHEEEDNLL